MDKRQITQVNFKINIFILIIVWCNAMGTWLTVAWGRFVILIINFSDNFDSLITNSSIQNFSVCFSSRYSRHWATETSANGGIDSNDYFADIIHLGAWLPLATMDAKKRLPLIWQHKASECQQKEANPSDRNNGGQSAYTKSEIESTQIEWHRCRNELSIFHIR